MAQWLKSEGDFVSVIEFVVVEVGRLGNLIGDDDGNDLIVVGLPDDFEKVMEELEVGDRVSGFPMLRDRERLHVAGLVWCGRDERWRCGGGQKGGSDWSKMSIWRWSRGW